MRVGEGTSALSSAVAPAVAPPRPLRLATYNIHKFVGNDGRRDPARIVKVLREVDADILCIQEFDARAGRGDLLSLEELEQEIGYKAHLQATRHHDRGGHGNLILARIDPHTVERHDIGAAEFEARGLMVADFDIDGMPLRVANTHLALWPAARKRQAARLTQQLSAPHNGIMVLAGDLNEWLPVGCSHTLFRDSWGAHPNPPTFPAPRPVVGFDRVWVAPRRCLVHLEVHQSPLARLASDHLPLKATLDFAGAVASVPVVQPVWEAERAAG